MTRASAGSPLAEGPGSPHEPAVRGGPRHGASTIIAQRIVQIPLVLFVVSGLVFLLTQVVPGDPGRNALGPYATADQVAAWNAAHGLEGGVIDRYLSWLSGLLFGEWGTSLVYGGPVLDLVLGRFINSVALGALAFAILVPAAVGIGVLQSRKEGSRTDRAVTVVLMALSSVPEFVLGVVLLVVFAVAFPVLPVQSQSGAGGGIPPLSAMVLPSITLALGSLAVIARTTRAGIVEVMTSQFYRTAVVRGVEGGMLFRRHIARNALIPTVSLLGISLGALLGGSAVVETLFGYPGLGELMVTATQRKDTAVLAAGVMLTGFIVMLALLIADVTFTLLDPRVRFRGRL